MMQIVDDLTKLDLRRRSIVTIGAFDGLHRGHQALIEQVVRQARATDCAAVLITFHPHPAAVLTPDRAPRLLTTPAEKAALLAEMGLDLMVLLPFDRETAATPARAFMETLCAHLHPRQVWVGDDFALGRGRQGDVAYLRELGRELGYELHALEPLREGGQIISSSRIRALLAQGAVEEAAELLGRYPRLAGEVVYGAQRGRALGFPTANQEVPPERAVPANGVYAAFALLGDERLPAVTNVGVRPSFDNGQRTVETHIFDFDRDIYGCELVVEFVARLRDERRFEDIEDLAAQIAADGEQA
ncbi:MAG TPA: bifunctional riboflavin kinase/FAD synthetase, partial [Anaerolineae bacterium]|nr:bifunctional riboflavin kinase/FAD synthetase [Anaerolineae bacterium]